MIRDAEERDLTKIVEMSEKFYPFTSYWTCSKIPFDPIAIGALASMLMEHSIMKVSEEDGKVIGMIGCVVMPFMFNPEYLVCGEIIWWVEPEYWSKGIGQQLLSSIEEPCRKEGVRHIQMVDLEASTASAEALYRKNGYLLTERTWTKVV